MINSSYVFHNQFLLHSQKAGDSILETILGFLDMIIPKYDTAIIITAILRWTISKSKRDFKVLGFWLAKLATTSTAQLLSTLEGSE